MAKKNTKNKTVENTKAERITYKDVLMTTYFQGAEKGLEQAQRAADVRAMLTKVIAELENAANVDDETTHVFRVALEALPESSGRGRRSPEPGDSRVYRAQALGATGDPFIRLPVSALANVDKGSDLIVHFEGDQLVVAPYVEPKAS